MVCILDQFPTLHLSAKLDKLLGSVFTYDRVMTEFVYPLHVCFRCLVQMQIDFRMLIMSCFIYIGVHSM